MTSNDQTSERSSIRQVVAASFIGTTIEWYDFFLYGTAAALVFNKLFFPKVEPSSGTLLALATYGVGFAARPLGGIIFGHYGDRIGRKTMLVLSLLIMGIATFLIGLMPTYAAIGIWAPIILVVLRIAQGIGVGGEWGRAHVGRARPTGPARLLRQLAPDGRARRPVPVHGGLPDRPADHLGGGVPVLGLAGPVPAQRRPDRRRPVRAAAAVRVPRLPAGQGHRHRGPHADPGRAAQVPA
jgi:hypothetical protein